MDRGVGSSGRPAARSARVLPVLGGSGGTARRETRPDDEDLPLRALRPARVLREHACVNCGHTLAYLPDRRDGHARAGRRGPLAVARLDGGGEARRTGSARTTREENVCNWAVPADDPNPFCRSCRLTRVIPDLSQPRHPRGLGAPGGGQAPADLQPARPGPAPGEQGRGPRAAAWPSSSWPTPSRARPGRPRS